MLVRRRELNAYKTQSRQANILMDLGIYLVRENRPQCGENWARVSAKHHGETCNGGRERMQELIGKDLFEKMSFKISFGYMEQVLEREVQGGWLQLALKPSESYKMESNILQLLMVRP